MPSQKQLIDEHSTESTQNERTSGHRVTATELIDGVQHLLILEQDATGCYQEVGLEPLFSRPRRAVPQTV